MLGAFTRGQFLYGKAKTMGDCPVNYDKINHPLKVLNKIKSNSGRKIKHNAG